MAVTNNEKFIQIFDDYLLSLKSTLTNEDIEAEALPKCWSQFQKEQLNFHQQLNNLSNYDVKTIQDISGALSGVLERTKEVENTFRTTLDKRNHQANQSIVKELRSIADLFRTGDDAQGMQKFGVTIPDGDGRVAGDVFGALWKVKKEPRIDDVGRLSFYNQSSQCVSTPFQKAFAIELAMVKTVCKALESGNQELAFVEFRELPYRLKKEVYLLLAQKKSPASPEIETGRKCFFNLNGLGVEKGVTIECLKTLETKLGKDYSNASDLNIVVMLQLDLREALEGKGEKENLLLSQIVESQKKETEFFETLRMTQQTVLRRLADMSTKMQEQMEGGQKEVTSLKEKMIEMQLNFGVKEGMLQAEFESRIERLTEKLSQRNLLPLKIEKLELAEEGLLNLPKPTLAEAFADYVHEKCPDYEVKDVKEFIDEGKDLVEKIQNGQAASIPIGERKRKMVPLVWYMLYFSVCKNQGFSQGTIVFRDPGHAISKFFLACGQPAVYPRQSSHFPKRLLPTFFEGEEKITSYGIDIPQDHKNGLPANKQTVNFCPIQTKDKLDWSFFKPEEWGLGDWYQFMRHTWDYIATRPAHMLGEPNGPDDRKEHLPAKLKEEFKKIYAEATGQNTAPDDVKTFGIAGAKAVFETMLNDEEISDEIKTKIENFLKTLRKKYDYLDARNGKEAMLGESFINGKPPQPNLHTSILESDLIKLQTKDAQVRVKNAAYGKELLSALSTLKERLPLENEKKNQVDEVAAGFRMVREDSASLLDQTQIFAQVNKDLEDNIKVSVDKREFKDAQALYEYLLKVETFAHLQGQEKEQAVLRLITMLQHGAKADLIRQLEQWYEQPIQGVHIKQVTSSRASHTVATISVDMNKDPIISINQLFELIGSDHENQLFYREKPYALIKGSMEIDFNQQRTLMKAAIIDVAKA